MDKGPRVLPDSLRCRCRSGGYDYRILLRFSALILNELSVGQRFGQKQLEHGISEHAARPYTALTANEDTVLQEAMDNLKEAGQRIRATQSLMRSQGMTDGENHRDLLTHLSTALAMTEAAYLEARRRRDL